MADRSPGGSPPPDATSRYGSSSGAFGGNFWRPDFLGDFLSDLTRFFYGESFFRRASRARATPGEWDGGPLARAALQSSTGPDMPKPVRPVGNAEECGGYSDDPWWCGLPPWWIKRGGRWGLWPTGRRRRRPQVGPDYIVVNGTKVFLPPHGKPKPPPDYIVVNGTKVFLPPHGKPKPKPPPRDYIVVNGTKVFLPPHGKLPDATLPRAPGHATFNPKTLEWCDPAFGCIPVPIIVSGTPLPRTLPGPRRFPRRVRPGRVPGRPRRFPRPRPAEPGRPPPVPLPPDKRREWPGVQPRRDFPAPAPLPSPQTAPAPGPSTSPAPAGAPTSPTSPAPMPGRPGTSSPSPSPSPTPRPAPTPRPGPSPGSSSWPYTSSAPLPKSFPYQLLGAIPIPRSSFERDLRRATQKDLTPLQQQGVASQLAQSPAAQTQKCCKCAGPRKKKRTKRECIRSVTRDRKTGKFA
jgi:hypothetical protein